MDELTAKLWIKKGEGLRLKPYRCTKGKLTIGYGHNLDANGISPAAANFIFNEDFEYFKSQLGQYHFFKIQPPGVQYALIKMAFNMGIEGLLGFEKMIAALEKHDYTNACKEALDSKWAKIDVPNRAKDIALIIREGK